MAFWWMGQMGYAVRVGNSTLFLDLYLSDSPKRTIAPICRAEEICFAGYFFGTHDHSDHIDRPIWPILAKASPKAKFVVPRALAHRLSEELHISLERFLPISDGETTEDGELKITGVASAHEKLSPDPISGEYPCMGYVIECGGVSFYHSGDTCLYEGLPTKLRSLGKLDAVFLPINGRDGKRLRSGCIGNLTFQEAVDLAGPLAPGIAVPGHYEMFRHNSENPLLFADYLDAKYPGVDCWIGPHGDRVLIEHGHRK